MLAYDEQRIGGAALCCELYIEQCYYTIEKNCYKNIVLCLFFQAAKKIHIKLHEKFPHDESEPIANQLLSDSSYGFYKNRSLEKVLVVFRFLACSLVHGDPAS
jgi:hypothetical protein